MSTDTAKEADVDVAASETTEEVAPKPPPKSRSKVAATTNGKKQPSAKSSKVEHWTIPLNRITGIENCRNEPETLHALGYDLIKLIKMGLSDDIEEVRSLVNLMEMHEGDIVELEDGTDQVPKLVTTPPKSIVAFAQRLKMYGQFNPIIVRKGGKLKDGSHNFTLLAGARRTAATIYNHAKSRVEVADEVEDAKVIPAEIIGVDRQVSKDDGFNISVEENLSSKTLTALQEGAIYHQMRTERVNPETGKHWTITEIADYFGINKSTVRNREALLKPFKPAKKDEKTGEVLKPATGLTDERRTQLDNGEITLTAAIREALGEQHYSKSAAPKGTRAKPLPLKAMQELFDKSDESNTERRKAIAECMGLTLAKAAKESEERIEKQEDQELRKRKRVRKKSKK